MNFNHRKYVSIALLALVQMSVAMAISAQSTDPNFPTPVETNEINGEIKARDIGDSRLTSYFYTFDGGQGDIFINVVSSNFAGDIDVFAADALRPLTKMVIYPEGGTHETGRLIYLRKGERLILRIEGRSPNDDPATYRVKFGGSFIALAGQKVEDAPTVARLKDEESGVRVNSVGTIVAVIPKPQPPKTVVAVEKKPEPAAAKAREPVAKAKAPAKSPPPAKKKTTESGVPTVFGKTTVRATAPAAKRPPIKSAAMPKVTAKVGTGTARPAKPLAKREEPKIDPLASIRLVVELKDGNVLERPMSEVLRFSVDKGVLTVIGKNGKVERYSILDVEKVTIQ